MSRAKIATVVAWLSNDRGGQRYENLKRYIHDKPVES